ncbi:Scr1 family TA system antitoxin-like transcriptional regulator [Longimycelium tulufanense]|uniref:Scr1 family TA system antitoxin-like transcriptional regulator n=1 Tax=Longimycelium tulufanense TaxID=907463 RepID=UPI0035712F55
MGGRWSTNAASEEPTPNAGRVLEKRVRARTARQKILRRADFPIPRVILGEMVLRRPVGGVPVIRGRSDFAISSTCPLSPT